MLFSFVFMYFKCYGCLLVGYYVFIYFRIFHEGNHVIYVMLIPKGVSEFFYIFAFIKYVSSCFRNFAIFVVAFAS